jgi:integrase
MTDQTPTSSNQTHISAFDSTHSPLVAIGRAADASAARSVFVDYLARKSANTVRAQAAALARFASFLEAVGEQVDQPIGRPLALFAQAVADFPTGALPDVEAWHGVSWGLIEGFRNWMVGEGDAMASINARLSTIKTYAQLALKAGIIEAEAFALIMTVKGYSVKECRRLDEHRGSSRRGAKKAIHVHLDNRQARQLKTQPDTPQGRRDALLMCLLLDHGLRVGEVARLQIADADLDAGEMRFYRPKVDKVQTHKLTADTLRALLSWVDSGDAPEQGALLRGSRKGGGLTTPGMSERAITERVRVLGETVGVQGLSAHDCRHYWATYWADKVDVLRLQEAGGWSSLAMPRRYVEERAIANEGMA